MGYLKASMTMCGNGDCYYDQCECETHDHEMVQECEGESVLGLDKRCPFEGKDRKFAYGWNGAEYAYEHIDSLCDDCYDALPSTGELAQW